MRAFIRDQTRLRPVPNAPEISLYVADEATELWQKTEEELGAIGLPPPFWAFAWAGGQALARYVLDHPETVRGRRVLDFASGSGLVAIAAMKAGAPRGHGLRHRSPSRLRQSGSTPPRTASTSSGPADLVGRTGGWDTVLAGDICYERDLARRVTRLALRACAGGAPRC